MAEHTFRMLPITCVLTDKQCHILFVSFSVKKRTISAIWSISIIVSNVKSTHTELILSHVRRHTQNL